MSYAEQRGTVIADPVLSGIRSDLKDPIPISFGDRAGFAQLLLAKRAGLARAFLLGFAFSALVALLIPNRYESTTRLMPPDASSSSSSLLMTAGLLSSGGNTASPMGMLAGDLLGLKNAGSLFVGMLRSQRVQDELVNRFDLRKIYGCRYMEQAREQLSENTIVTEDRKSGIITISVRDRKPERAAALASTYVEVLNRVNSELNVSSAHRERLFLEQRLAEVRQELTRSSKGLSEFSSKSATLDPKEQGKSLFEAAARLEGERIAAESELAGVEQIYTPNNVRARSLKARISSLAKQLEDIRGKGDVAASGQPNEDNKGLYPTITQLPLLGVTYFDLYRNVKIEEAVFETLTKQYEITKIEEAKETPTVQVLDRAAVPERKVSPPRALLTLTGALFVVAFTIVWFRLKEQWDTTDSSDERKVLISVLGSDIAAKMRRLLRRRRISSLLSSDHSNKGL